MKTITTSIICVLIYFSMILSTAFAQSPIKFNYQAIIHNSSNEIIPNTTIGIKISLLANNENGSISYAEKHQPTSNENGLISLIIGNGTPLSGDLNTLNWNNNSYYIKSEIDLNGGTNYTISGVSQLLSVPYALHANTVTNTSIETDPIFISWNKNFNDLNNKPTTIAGYGITDAVRTTENQTISGNKTFTGTLSITNPTNPNDAATKAYVDNLIKRIEALEETNLLNNGFKDIRDGYQYKVVKIGTKFWLAENLRYLPNVSPFSNGSYTSPFYYVYDYNGTDISIAKATDNYKTYGVLYNWDAAKISCPSGWHLPSDQEWNELETALGGAEIAGGKLKEVGLTHWLSPNTGATNESLFYAIPGGVRSVANYFGGIGQAGIYWSNTEESWGNSYGRQFVFDNVTSQRVYYGKGHGLSVRCVKD